MDKIVFLEDVRGIVEEREEQHGSPKEIFESIAIFWSDYLNRTHGFMMDLSGMDVALMMDLFKIARVIENPKGSLDSLMDIAGYAACAAELGGLAKE
jgi:hypothetical protein|nr:MAG TPA: hypothetical protein [Caudoviricetes sp.]